MVEIDLRKGDCLELMKDIEDNSVDLIVTDPPYGTIKNIRNSPASLTTGLKKNEWDTTLDTEKMFLECQRILRNNGKLILFAQEPYTNKLISETHYNLPFSYKMIWKKDHFANPLLSKVAPLNYYEEILVFSKTSGIEQDYDYEYKNPLRDYFKSVLEFIDLPKNIIMKKIGQRADHTFRVNSTQFVLCSEQTYLDLIKIFNIDKAVFFKDYNDLKIINLEFKRDTKISRDKYVKNYYNKYPNIFNLEEGKKFKSNILEYKKDYGGLHPTQKPVALFEDLIKTYSNEEDLVLDFTAGSGTTGVACQNLNRNCILMEKDEQYCKIIEKRLQDNKKAKTLLSFN